MDDTANENRQSFLAEDPAAGPGFGPGTDGGAAPAEDRQDHAAPGFKCSNCGAALSSRNVFCTACGSKVGAVDETREKTKEKKGRSKRMMIFGVAALAVLAVAAVALIAAFAGGRLRLGGAARSHADLKWAYEFVGNSTDEWIRLGDDESYIFLDSNPSDQEDDADRYLSEVSDAVSYLNWHFDLPDSLTHDMVKTWQTDAAQSETFHEAGITVSWRYHETNGLEITYRTIR